MTGSVSGVATGEARLMLPSRPSSSPRQAFGMSPRTFAIIRWTQVGGQAFTILFVRYSVGIELPVATLMLLVALGGVTTLWTLRQMHSAQGLPETQLAVVLLTDVVIVGTLLGLTGGLANPFALFLLVPAVLAATTLGLGWCTAVCAAVVAASSGLAVWQVPVPWAEVGYRLPAVLITGTWAALTFGTVLIASYVWRIAEENRRISRALVAARTALDREQRLTELDGLATAVAHDLASPLSTIRTLARELIERLPSGSEAHRDALLLHDETRRCRDILTTLTRQTPSSGPLECVRVPLTVLLEHLVESQRAGAISVQLDRRVAPGLPEPQFPLTGEVRHALGNLLDNGVTYARSTVLLTLDVAADRTILSVEDDGPGFPTEVLGRIGEPFQSTRHDGATHGLGLFIACTFLMRSGAQLEFTNRGGARVTITWRHGRDEGKRPWTT